MHSKAPNPSAGLFWPAALNWRSPSVTCGAEWNTKLRESYVSLSDEWQAFVGRRTKEDLRLLQQLASAKAPEEMWSVYASFWQKAVEDYWQGYATIVKLASGLISSDTAATQQAFEQAPEAKTSLPRAA
jgi:Phasin protein